MKSNSVLSHVSAAVKALRGGLVIQARNHLALANELENSPRMVVWSRLLNIAIDLTQQQKDEEAADVIHRVDCEVTLAEAAAVINHDRVVLVGLCAAGLLAGRPQLDSDKVVEVAIHVADGLLARLTESGE